MKQRDGLVSDTKKKMMRMMSEYKNEYTGYIL